MDVSQVYIVDELKQKVNTLAQRLDKQRGDAEILRNENKELYDRLRKQEEELKELKKYNDTLKLSKAFVLDNGNDAHEAKVQINRIVREIDKCIALLNR